MASIDDYKCEHLFLLVGGNPLPNYVAAKLLARKSEQSTPGLYLVHSPAIKDVKGNEREPGTEKYADYLSQVLGAEFKKMWGEDIKPGLIKFIPVKESDPRSIKEGIKNYFPGHDIPGTVGLNYTGGTKAMAVHAYLTIKELCELRRREAHFSYLNPRELEMCFDPLPGRNIALFKLGDPQHATDRRYFEDVKISSTQLLQLHGLKLRQPEAYEEKFWANPRPSVFLSELAQCLLEISLNDADLKQWQLFVNTRNGTLFQFVEQTKKGSFNYPNDKNSYRWERYRNNLKKGALSLPAIPKLTAELHKLNLIGNNNELALINYDEDKLGQSVDHFCEWLKGKWLEDYLLHQIVNLKNSCYLHDYGVGLEPAVPGKEKEPFFEIDAIALRGYQLFAFSCTTDSGKQRCKQKLFEAFVRARQLGGDEARVALISMHTRPSELQRELEQEWSVERDKIKVFGKNDLLKLQSKLQEWFNGQS